MSQVRNDSVISDRLARLHDRIRTNTEGAVPDYIPELLNVDANAFGIAVTTADGQRYAAGDAEAPFTIQSISKPFIYGIALDEYGPDFVLSRIGVEPSGDAFNSIVMDEKHGRPPNPMVNAGAIASSSLVPGGSLHDRQQLVLDVLSRYAGRRLEVDWAVFESERATGHRNRAIAFLELGAGMIQEPVTDHLDLYFTQCAVLVTASDLALMAATLTNGGVNPLTGERAITSANVHRVLTVMTTCGMYDWSGEWMYRVGLPAKSGVGGGIIAVLPGQFGLGTYSPRLDAVGNSVRGVEVCTDFASEFSLHLLDVSPSAITVIRRQYDASVVSSQRMRSSIDRSILDREGRAIVVYEVQGDLFFASAEQLVRAVEAREEGARNVILDTRRVGRANPSALSLLGQLLRRVEEDGVRIGFAACRPEMRSGLEASVPFLDDQHFWSTVDEALEQCEDSLLALSASTTESRGVLEPGEIDMLRHLNEEELALLAPCLERVEYEPGSFIIRQSAPADRLYFLAAGSATAQLTVAEPDAPVRRLGGFGAGVAFGETALYERGQRTADVTADGRVTTFELAMADLHSVAEEHPQILSKLLILAGENLSRLLLRATEQIRTFEA